MYPLFLEQPLVSTSVSLILYWMLLVLQFTGNGDYISVVNRSVFFTNANKIQNVTVRTLSDSLTEIYETFTAVLSSVFLAVTTGGATIGLTDQERARLIIDPDIATINILDDDCISLIILLRIFSYLT